MSRSNGGIDMEATELMIGDWVGRVFDDKRIDYRQVDWIRTGEIGMRYQKVWAIGCIEPIPLTPEILEKNGFSFVKSSDRDSVWNGWWINKGLELATCCLDKEGNWPCYINIYDSNIKCEYVHQLQHALRLCGLDELADNFKI